MLNTLVTGPGTAAAPPLVVAHGLFGAARNWGAVARDLAAERRVVAADMRNHGDSPWAQTNDYPAMADDLAEVIDAQGGAADVLGHSMGGKAAMVLALRAPDRVRRLIVVDIAPVAYDHDQMAYIDAMRGLDLSGVTRRGEADARLAGTVPDPSVRAFLLQSLDLRGGRPRWKLNLDTLAAEMDTLVGWPGIEGRFDGPALFLTGARSEYVRDAHWPRIAALFPAARRETVPEAGHWLHAEKPVATAAAVRAFLDG